MAMEARCWRKAVLLFTVIFFVAALNAFVGRTAAARDLAEITREGVIRHLGVPYANFVSGSGDGLDVELIKLFAEHQKVRYEYVKTDWQDVIPDLTGKKVRLQDGQVAVIGEAPVKGDVIANGMTIIPWRQQVVNFSLPTFPTQVWLLARSDSNMQPITPTGDIEKDIALTKQVLRGNTTMGKKQTCLDPDLYNLSETASSVKLFDGALNELAPAVIGGGAESTILDVPDALIALEKWPGELKVIGPISEQQEMGVAFAKTSPQLQKAFNTFLEEIKKDGTYHRLVKKYYAAIFNYYPEFFTRQKISRKP